MFIGIGMGILGGGGVSTYTISGIVYDADETTPVEGATVALGALSAVSAANGTYTISAIPAGASGSMTCTKTGYSWTVITVSAMSASLTAQNYINVWWATGGIGVNIRQAYQPIGAVTLSASYINIANPGTNNAAPGTAPTFNTNDGWTFNGSNQYLTTGLAPVAGESLVVRYSTASSLMILCHDGVNFYGFEKDTSKVYYEKGGFVLSSTIPVAGVLAIASNKGLIDGVVDKTIGAGTGLPTTRELVIGARNANGTINGWTAFKVQAFARYAADITSQLPALVAAMNALP